MKYIILFMCALLIGGLNPSLKAGDSKTTKTAVVDCAGAASACTAVVNAVGDVISYDVTGETPKFLGKISQEKKISVDFPQVPGTKTLYSLVPGTGESQGKLIYVLFDNVIQRPGSKDFGKTVIKIYRQFTGEPATQWTEVGMLVTPTTAIPGEEITIQPDGTASWTRSTTGEVFIFALGRINLKV